MPELYPLTDLSDPVAFLKGARIPLTTLPPLSETEDIERAEWNVDGVLLVCADDVTLWHPNEQSAWRVFALDLTDPDVARWVDRKIAGRATGAADNCLARLVIYEGEWMIEVDGSLKRLRACFDEGYPLASIPCIEPNISAARSALLRALFGREKTP